MHSVPSHTPCSQIITQEKPISAWLSGLVIRCLCRFAANQKSQHFTLGAEGSGTVAAVGSGVTNLKVTSFSGSWSVWVAGWASISPNSLGRILMGHLH